MAGRRTKSKAGTPLKGSDTASPEVADLRAQLVAAQAAKAAIDEENWNLRVELQSRTEATEKLETRLSRLETERNRAVGDRETELESNDGLRARVTELQDLLEREKARHGVDSEQRRREVEGRESYIEQLTETLSAVRQENATLQHQTKQQAQQLERLVAATEIGVNDNVDSSTDIFDPDQSLGPDDLTAGVSGHVPTTPSRNASLESDTQKAALAHAQRQLMQLRQALQREKAEKIELRQQLRSSGGSDPSGPPSSRSGPIRRVGRHRSTRPQSWRSSGSSGRPHDTSRSDSEESEGEPWSQSEEGEPDYGFASQFHMDPQTQSEYFTSRESQSEDYYTGRETIGESDGHEDSATETERGFRLSEEFVSREEVERQAAEHGLAVIPLHELQALQAGAEEQNLESIRKHLATKYNARILNEDEYKALTNPSKSTLTSHAHAIEHQLMPINEYESLVNPSLESLEELAGILNYTMVHKDKLQQLSNPDLDKLAAARNLKLVPMDFHMGQSTEEVIQKTHVLQDLAVAHKLEFASSQHHKHRSPSELTIGELRDAARSHGLELIGAEDDDSVRELATRRQWGVVPISALCELVDTKILPNATVINRPLQTDQGEVMCFLSLPDIDRIQKHLECPLISREELAELQRRALSPTSRDLAAAAATQGLAVIAIDKLDEIQYHLEHPTVEVVRKQAELYDLRVLDASEYTKLSDLDAVAASRNLVVVSKDDYETLEHPDPATIQRLAKFHGLVTISDAEMAELNDLRNDDHRPAIITEQQLRESANEQGFILLTKTEHEELLQRVRMAERHSKDPALMSLAARREHFEDMIRTSGQSPKSPEKASPLRKSLKSLGYEFVHQDEYRRLLASQKVYEPTKSDVMRAAKLFDLVAVPAEEYYQRSVRSSPSRNTGTSAGGLPSTPGKRISTAFAKDASPGAASTTSSNGDDEELKAVPASYIEALRQIVETPTRSDVEQMAIKLGLQLRDNDGNEVVTKIEPSQAEIIERAKALGLVEPLTDEELLATARSRGLELGLEEPMSNDDIVARALALGLVKPPTPEEILVHAKSLGMVDSASLMDAAKAKGLREQPSDIEIRQMAQTLGLLEPLADDQIVETAKSLGLVEPLSEQEILDAAKAKGLREEPLDAEIREKALSLGLVEPLDDAQIKKRAKSLGYIEPLTDAQIKESARALGLMEPLSEQEILDAAKAKGLREEPSDAEIRHKAKALGLIEPLNEAQIRETAKSLGLSEPLTDSQIKESAKSLGLVEPLTDAQIKSSATALGLVEPLSEQELLHIAKTKGLREEPSDAEIREKATAIGLFEPLNDVQIKEKAMSLGLVEPLDDTQVKEKAKSLGLVEPMTDAQIKDSAKSLGLVEPLSDTQIKQKAKSLGLAEPLSEQDILSAAKTKGLKEQPSEAEICDIARSLGLAEPLTNTQIKENAKSLGLVEPMTDTQIKETAKSLGLVEPFSEKDLLDTAKAKGLREDLSETEIRDRAKAMGLVEPLGDDDILVKAKSLGLVEPPTDTEILKKAKSLGLVVPLDDSQIVSKAKSIGLQDPPNDAETTELAEAKGFIRPLTDAQIREKALELGLVVPPSDAEIYARATTKLGLVEAQSDAQITQRARSLGLVEPLNDTQIMQKAKAKGLQEPPSDADLAELIKSRGYVKPLSDAQVLERGRALGLVDAPTEAEIRRRAYDLGLVESSHASEDPENPSLLAPAVLSTPANPIQTSAAPADSAALGFARRRHPSGSFSAGAPSAENLESESLDAGAKSEESREGDDVHLKLSGATKSRGEGHKSDSHASHQEDAKNAMIREETDNTDMDTTISISMDHGEDGETAHPFLTTPMMDHKRMPPPHSSVGAASPLPPPRIRGRGLQRGQGHFGSMSTLSTFNPARIDVYKANVSQLFVGEVLHKYTHGFSLNGMPGHRHKRYFWVHPYTMTLYWQRENPAILGGRVGTPRSAAIVSVEEQRDFNSQPAGLYYKTIIIHSTERDIRITCPTRMRHFVWYNSLRYLVDVSKGGSGATEDPSVFPESLRESTESNDH